MLYHYPFSGQDPTVKELQRRQKNLKPGGTIFNELKGFQDCIQKINEVEVLK
ncbi:unnamed protein product [Sphenostylis stenocarpa]|uniref:Uncharacterized protein n=1 Tax=Sphenostylis stenocarpa TaxID=92480 RepID=A0AA86SAZ9_9FABA|nr:unnamed protein product [Sphenostylis stenocarpa]